MIRRALSTAVAFVVTLVVLFGAFSPVPLLQGARAILLQWAVLLSAFAFVLGFLHLIRVHLVRLGRRAKGWDVSLLVILTSLATMALVLWQGVDSDMTQLLVSDFLVSGESALLALTAVTLILAAMRMVRFRRDVAGFLFLLVVILTLLGAAPSGGVGMLAGLAQPIIDVFAVAGMRGLVIGVALGTVLAGLRMIFVTRPYSDD